MKISNPFCRGDKLFGVCCRPPKPDCCPCPGPQGPQGEPGPQGPQGPQGEPGASSISNSASFFSFEMIFENGRPMPFIIGTADTAGEIRLENDTQIILPPGYYYVSYSVSAVLDSAGYMQVTPSYNGAPHLEYGVYFRTGAALTSACGANSIIFYAPSQTDFSLTFNSNSENRSGAASVSVIRINKD